MKNHFCFLRKITIVASSQNPSPLLPRTFSFLEQYTGKLFPSVLFHACSPPPPPGVCCLPSNSIWIIFPRPCHFMWRVTTRPRTKNTPGRGGIPILAHMYKIRGTRRCSDWSFIRKGHAREHIVEEISQMGGQPAAAKQVGLDFFQRTDGCFPT